MRASHTSGCWAALPAAAQGCAQSFPEGSTAALTLGHQSPSPHLNFQRDLGEGLYMMCCIPTHMFHRKEV